MGKEHEIAEIAEIARGMIFEFISNTYSPGKEGSANPEYYTTLELYEKIGSIYPEMPLTPNELAYHLQEYGFKFQDTGEKIYWILNRI